MEKSFDKKNWNSSLAQKPTMENTSKIHFVSNRSSGQLESNFFQTFRLLIRKVLKTGKTQRRWKAVFSNVVKKIQERSKNSALKNLKETINNKNHENHSPKLIHFTRKTCKMNFRHTCWEVVLKNQMDLATNSKTIERWQFFLGNDPQNVLWTWKKGISTASSIFSTKLPQFFQWDTKKFDEIFLKIVFFLKAFLRRRKMQFWYHCRQFIAQSPKLFFSEVRR